MKSGWRAFDHTADAGAAVRGATLERLFENAAHALFGLICDVRRVEPRAEVRIAVEGSSLEDLLVRWLSELLYRHETGGWLFASFAVDAVDASACRMSGAARGETLDRGRHRLRREIKAITYHQIRVKRGRRGWSVRLVFDI